VFSLTLFSENFSGTKLDCRPFGKTKCWDQKASQLFKYC